MNRSSAHDLYLEAEILQAVETVTAETAGYSISEVLNQLLREALETRRLTAAPPWPREVAHPVAFHLAD